MVRTCSTTKPRRCPADRKSTRLNSSHSQISYAVFCLKKKNSAILLIALHSPVLALPLSLSDVVSSILVIHHHTMANLHLTRPLYVQVPAVCFHQPALI